MKIMEQRQMKSCAIIKRCTTNFCRICLKSDTLESWDSVEYLQELFEHITGLKVDVNDDSQKNVCIKCIEKLEDISVFIDISKYNDITIRNNPSPNKIDLNSANMCNIDEMCDINRCSEDSRTFNDYYKTLALQQIYKHEVQEHHITEMKTKFQLEQESYNRPMFTMHHFPNTGKFYNSSESLTYNPPTVTNDVDIKQKQPKKRTKSRNQMKSKTPDHLRPFECPFCKKRFTQKGNMQTHLRLHTGEKPFQCLLCPEKFPQLSNLNKHIQNHTSDVAKCDVCFTVFNSKDELKEHRKTHKADKQYLCYFCSKKFSYRWSLDAHMQLHHKDQSVKSLPVEKNTYKCQVCFLEFNLKNELMSHEQSHANNQHFCVKCSKTFRCLGHLNNHLKKCEK